METSALSGKETETFGLSGKETETSAIRGRTETSALKSKVFKYAK